MNYKHGCTKSPMTKMSKSMGSILCSFLNDTDNQLYKSVFHANIMITGKKKRKKILKTSNKPILCYTCNADPQILQSTKIFKCNTRHNNISLKFKGEKETNPTLEGHNNQVLVVMLV